MDYLILRNAYLLCEVNVKGQVGFIIVSYLSPTQTSPQFDDFLSNFEKLFDDVQIFQPSFTVILGDSMLGQNHGGLVTQPQFKVLD